MHTQTMGHCRESYGAGHGVGCLPDSLVDMRAIKAALLTARLSERRLATNKYKLLYYGENLKTRSTHKDLLKTGRQSKQPCYLDFEIH